MVIANPSSFASLPEYCEEDEVTDESVAAIYSVPGRALFYGNIDKTPLPSTAHTDPVDPNTIILKTFEDALGRLPVLSSPADPKSIADSITTTAPLSQQSRPWSPSHTTPPMSRIEEARNGGRDANLLDHYRRFISHRVIHVGIQDSREDSFEIQARVFPPVCSRFIFI